VEQADLSHHLQLHLFSLDKQVVSFTDHGVRVQKRISHPVTFDPLHTDQQQADFQVVMTLDDGKWRIRHFVRKPGPSASALPPVEIPDPDSALVRLEQGKFVYKNIPFQPAGVNYYPKEHPWFEFWENFDTCLLQRDLLLIRDLNLNLMRIFVPYQVFGAGEVKPQMLHRLAKVLDLAHASQIKVMVTLFDFPVGYALSDYAPTERHLKTILSQFHSHPALLAWDLKNEADLDFSPHGERRVQEWLAYMLERARVYDPHHLLTLGWAYSDHAHLFAEEVDFVSFHCYTEPGDFRYRLEELRKRVGEKPLLVSEFGMPTYRSLFVRGGKTEQEQAAYYQDVLQLLAEKGNIPFIAWTLHDFGELPDEVFGSSWRAKVPQKNFGLYRKNGQAKPVCEVLQAR
jgi:endo-1,4-beta-mannosidase